MIIAERIDALRPTLFSSIKYRFRHSGHLLRTRPGTSHLCLCIVRVWITVRAPTTYRRSIFKSSIASIVIIHITNATNHNVPVACFLHFGKYSHRYYTHISRFIDFGFFDLFFFIYSLFIHFAFIIPRRNDIFVIVLTFLNNVTPMQLLFIYLFFLTK